MFSIFQGNSSDVVIHHFREETHAIHAYSGAGKVVACLFVVRDRSIYLIEVAIEGSSFLQHLVFSHHSRTDLIGVTARLVSCSMTVIVEGREAVEIDAIGLFALEYFQQTSFPHRYIVFHYGN